MAEKRQRIHLDASALICCIHAKVALKLQGKRRAKAEFNEIFRLIQLFSDPSSISSIFSFDIHGFSSAVLSMAQSKSLVSS